MRKKCKRNAKYMQKLRNAKEMQKKCKTKCVESVS
jgi:hypothetical protein